MALGRNLPHAIDLTSFFGSACRAMSSPKPAELRQVRCLQEVGRIPVASAVEVLRQRQAAEPDACVLAEIGGSLADGGVEPLTAPAPASYGSPPRGRNMLPVLPPVARNRG